MWHGGQDKINVAWWAWLVHRVRWLICIFACMYAFFLFVSFSFLIGVGDGV